MRTISVSTLYKKKYKVFPFKSIWKDVFGEPSTGGIWIIYGKDKNGKTWGTLLIAEYLSTFDKVLYISAEEGVDMEFQAAVKRAKIDGSNKNIQFTEYETVDDIYNRLRDKKTGKAKRRAPRIVVIDNLTMYKGELTSNGLKQMMLDFPNTLFICVAHEDRNEPYTATAVMAKKLAKVIVRVQGLLLMVGGRCPGGNLMIDEEKALLYHGSDIKKEAL